MTFYVGVVEDRNDPYKSGRCRVRVFGLHTENLSELPVKDLPWAVPLLPATQAGTSGIGQSPTGLVEGQWVVVIYADEFKQQPIIIGSIGSSIPQKNDPSIPRDSAPATSGDNGSVTTTTTNPDGTTTTTTVPGQVGKQLSPTELKLSDAGASEIKRVEALCSISSTSKRAVVGADADRVPASAIIYPYLDTVAKQKPWTIGWGSTYLADGTKVLESTRLTKQQCADLFAYTSEHVYASGIRKALKVPVTQQMFDALVSIAYNTGVGGLTHSKAFSALNSGDYAACSALIPETRSSAALKSRRTHERAMFDSEGYPSKTVNTPEPTPSQSLATQLTPTTPSSVISDAITTVNQLIDRFITPTPVTEVQNVGLGFRDPNGKYPSYKNESDTNRLTSSSKLENTIVDRKDASRTTGVVGADGKTWSQPRAPYNAMYPFNHVRQSESGHVEEYDDTPGAERTLHYHRSGTFSEVDVNGTRVNKIVGDTYEIMDRNGFISIAGNCNITIGGNASIRVANDATLQVLGNLTTNVSGNTLTNVYGNHTTNINGKCVTNVFGDYGVAVAGKTQFKSTGNIELQSAGNTNLDSAQIHLNSGNQVGLQIPTESTEPELAAGAPEFSELVVPSRRSDYDAVYETPEEGPPTQEYKAAVSKYYDEDEKTAPDGTNKGETAPSTSTPATDIPPSGTCTITTADIQPGMKISRLFTLGQLLTSGKSGTPRGTNYGLTPNEIVCNMRNLAMQCLDPIKAKYPNMYFSSVWRQEAVNTACNGQTSSDHLTGSAADMQFTGFSRKDYYNAIIEIQKILPSYRQLILEYKAGQTWIHVSYVSPGNRAGKTNNKQNMTINALKNQTISSNSFVLWD